MRSYYSFAVPLLTFSLFFSLSSVSQASTISRLKSGDVLVGKDLKTGKACLVAVQVADSGAKQVIVTVGEAQFKPVTLTNPGPATWIYRGSYSKRPYVDPQGSYFSDNIEATLTQSVFTGRIRFTFMRVIWAESEYGKYPPATDCQELKLR
jgi:hypothetical protein